MMSIFDSGWRRCWCLVAVLWSVHFLKTINSGSFTKGNNDIRKNNAAKRRYKHYKASSAIKYVRGGSLLLLTPGKVLHGVEESIANNFFGNCLYVVLPSSTSYNPIKKSIADENSVVRREEAKKISSNPSPIGVNEYNIAGFVKSREQPLLQSSEYHNATVNSLFKSDTMYYVLPIKPQDEEIEEYLSLPDAYTWVNQRLALGIVSGRSIVDEWVISKNGSWSIPPEHPRSNRSQCLTYTKLTSIQPFPLYTDNPIYLSTDTSKRRSGVHAVVPTAYQSFINSRLDLLNELNDFYLIYKQYAVIHETGIVASQYGYFQPLEPCELRFKFVGKNWYGACKRGLENWSIEWNDFVQARSTRELWQVLVDRRQNQDQGVPPFSFQQLNELCLTKAVSKHLATLAVDAPLYRFFGHYHGTESGNDRGGGMPLYDRVMIMTADWDTNYHHILLDLMTRIIRFVPFLQSNSDIRIHTRYYEQSHHVENEKYRLAAMRLRNTMMRSIGLDPQRLIFGFVKAREVYIPRSMNCAQPQTNALEVRFLAKHLINMALDTIPNTPPLAKTVSDVPIIDVTSLIYPPFKIYHDGRFEQQSNSNNTGQSQTILLQHRRCDNETECENPTAFTSWRQWTDKRQNEIMEILTNKFPSSRILSITDADAYSANCYECEIRGYREADVLIGYHGAGLTNVMFMKPGSILVEVTGEFDARMMPKCGYFGPLATIFGVHHLIYYFDYFNHDLPDFNEISEMLQMFQRRLSN